MENLLQVGVITTTHGIRGEVKVFPTTDDPRRFEELPSILLDTGKELCELEIQRVKYFKQFVILKFRDVDDINEIEPYNGKSLYLTRDMAVPLEENEYYIADLIGMDVFLEDGSLFGRIKDVLETGSNDVYIVQTQEKEVLITDIKDCILTVAVESTKLVIHLMKGMV